MSDPELVTYIRQQSAQGMSAQTLREELLSAGWRDADIENALHDVAAGLHPVTAGASIHEDLAQVRGLVSHLASRVQRLELQLPSGVPTGSDQMLLAPPRRSHVLMTFMLTLFIVAAVTFGWYMIELVQNNIQMPQSSLVTIAGVGLILFLLAILAMRRHKGWAATLLTASGVIAWTADTFVAWRSYHVLETQTAVAIGILLVILSLVMGRWIDRLQGT